MPAAGPLPRLGLSHALHFSAPSQGHASGLQIGSPEHELRRLLGLAGFPKPVLVEPVVGTMLGGRNVPWHAFLRRRETGKGRPAANGAGYGFRIEFPEAVQGPVAVGYASHFGMGGFVGEDKLQ